MIFLTLFATCLLAFVAVFITMLGGLMAALPGRGRLALALSLAGAFILLGNRSPNLVLARSVMTVCPVMVGLAWAIGTWRARRPMQERHRGVGTKEG